MTMKAWALTTWEPSDEGLGDEDEEMPKKEEPVMAAGDGRLFFFLPRVEAHTGAPGGVWGQCTGTDPVDSCTVHGCMIDICGHTHLVKVVSN